MSRLAADDEIDSTAFAGKKPVYVDPTHGWPINRQLPFSTQLVSAVGGVTIHLADNAGVASPFALNSAHGQETVIVQASAGDTATVNINTRQLAQNMCGRKFKIIEVAPLAGSVLTIRANPAVNVFIRAAGQTGNFTSATTPAHVGPDPDDYFAGFVTYAGLDATTGPNIAGDIIVFLEQFPAGTVFA